MRFASSRPKSTSPPISEPFRLQRSPSGKSAGSRGTVGQERHPQPGTIIRGGRAEPLGLADHASCRGHCEHMATLIPSNRTNARLTEHGHFAEAPEYPISFLAYIGSMALPSRSLLLGAGLSGDGGAGFGSAFW